MNNFSSNLLSSSHLSLPWWRPGVYLLSGWKWPPRPRGDRWRRKGERTSQIIYWNQVLLNNDLLMNSFKHILETQAGRFHLTLTYYFQYSVIHGAIWFFVQESLPKWKATAWFKQNLQSFTSVGSSSGNITWRAWWGKDDVILNNIIRMWRRGMDTCSRLTPIKGRSFRLEQLDKYSIVNPAWLNRKCM